MGWVLHNSKNSNQSVLYLPWLVWLSGLSARLQTKGPRV